MDIRMSNIASPMPQIRAKFTNKLGIPLSGCKVYTYEPNSDILKTTWLNIDKTVENTNPILLDSAGEADIFLDGLYRIVVKDRFGFVVYDVEKTGTTEWDASFVVDASGLNQQQINNLTLTPYHFGGVGDGEHHPLSEKYATLAEARVVYPSAVSLDDSLDSRALKALVTYIKSLPQRGGVQQININMSGTWYLTEPFEYLVNANSEGGIDGYMRGKPVFIAGFDGEYAVGLHGRAVGFSEFSYIDCKNRVKYGISVSASEDQGGSAYINSAINLGALHISNALVYGVRFREMSMFTLVDYLRCGDCGTPSNEYSYGKQLLANVTNQTNQQEGAIEGTTTFSVDTLPPYWDEVPTFVTYNGYSALIINANTNAKTIQVRPNIPSAATNGQLRYSWGGAAYTQGSDSAGIHIKHLSAVMCGGVLHHTAMYPCVVDYACSEFSGVSFYSDGLVSGADIRHAYFEGDLWQYLDYSEAPRTFGASRFGVTTAFNSSKWDYLRFGRQADGSLITGFSGLRNVSVYDKGTTHVMDPHKSPNNGIWGLNVNFNLPQTNLTFNSNSATILIAKVDPNSNRVFAYDTQEVTVVGTGKNDAPTGVISFTAPEGHTVNGSSSASFAGFSGAAHFVCYLDVVSKNIQISCSTLKEFNLSPSLSNVITSNNLDDAEWVDRKISLYDSGSTYANLPTNSRGQKGNVVVETYYLYGTQGVSHSVIQTATFENQDVLYRVKSSATGYFSAWALKSQSYTQGTSAQRPSTPPTGYQYFDTTLAAGGKPIWWNGSNWIDMTGTTV